MHGNNNLSSIFREDAPHFGSAAGKGKEKENEAGKDAEQGSCPAFGFLRGLDARALAVEFRFRDGNSEWFSYSCLVSFRFNPSVGLLLKFSGDVATLVLIQGSNLDAPVGEAQVNLTDRGLQRHRLVYVCEMGEDELKKARGGEPTIDRIDIAEFESMEEQREWLKKIAPQFVR